MSQLVSMGSACNEVVVEDARACNKVINDAAERAKACNEAIIDDDERRISLYTSKQHILLVGEGDFSFAKALATAFVSAPALVATSLDPSAEMLQSKYPMVTSTLESLEKSGVVVMHGVDVTCMAEDDRLKGLLFDRIVFNFPHAGFELGMRETCYPQIKANKQLLCSFFQNAARLLKDKGEVHVTHHVDRHPYTEWNLEGEAAKSALSLERCVPFNRSTYPGYVNRKGAGVDCARTFPLQLSGTHVFCKKDPSP